ncbi:S8 family serine peptidase [Eubacterium maltosivorans]|uniref:Peptidase S8/S53 domain-containing protein n=1 Tax=Eubacterium maltosivorans TaxID=2041044 RepID=A0A4P9CC40_EUBML|nr:S8 family serine peptidase [Eubacterium maltosivorans]QCT73167.1 hypothetical protein CPZ25_018230 [Eubacterium maltosivorans]
MKKLSALLLCCLLVFTALPSAALAENSGTAEPLSGDYIEGEAIVCMETSAAGMRSRSAVPELLANAEVLMTVDSGDTDEAQPQTFGLRSASSQSQVLALVKGEGRTTAELIAELENYDQVVFAEPNYRVEEYTDDAALTEGLEEAFSAMDENTALEKAPEAAVADQSQKAEDAAQTADEPQKPAADENTAEAKVDEAAAEAPAKVITKDMVSKDVSKMTDYQWGFDNSGQFGGKKDFDMNYDAWKAQNTAASGTDPVVVAVFDSGVDAENPDLAGKMWTKPADVNLPGGPHGYNPAEDNGDINDDDNGHGTHCAGIIGAEWNDIGVSGIGRDTQIMAVKRPNDTAGILKGYDYMVQACGAGVNLRVVSNSWGIAGQSQSLSRAVETLGTAGAISVFASGNSDLDIDNTSFMAAALKDNPYAVTVNATDYQGRRSGFSCYGQRVTDVMAPGSRILSTFHQNQSTETGKVSAEQYYAEFDANRLYYENFEDKANYWQFDGAQLVGNSGSYYDGQGVLKTDVTMETKWISSEPLDLSQLVKADASGQRYFSARAAVLDNEDVDIVAMAVKVRTIGEDGTVQMTAIGDQASGVNGGWAAFSGELPANTDYDHFTVEIGLKTGKVNAHHGSMQLTLAAGTVVLDSFGIGSDAQPYTYMDGTSMACPAAAGAAAVMASQYPDQNAANLAARLVGSVKRDDAFTALCVSGGQVDLSKAGDPYPVINRAIEDGNAVTVEGYFFGGTPAVTLGGSDAVVKETKTTADNKTTLTVEKPEGFAGGMTQIVVKNGDKTGQGSFELGARTDRVYYDQTNLPLPQDEAFYNMDGGQLVGYDGSLYYLPASNVISNTTTDVIWRYDPEKQSWSTVALPAPVTNMVGTTWNGRLLVYGTDLTSNKIYFALYDGSNWQMLEYGEDQTAALSKVLLPGIINDGSRVLLFGGYDGSDATSVYEFNVETGALSETGITLKTGRISPQVAYQNGEYLVSGGFALGWNLGAVQDVELVTEDGSTHIIEQPGVTQEQQYGFTGAAVKGGYQLAGGVNTLNNADTYTLASGGNTLEVYGKRAADSALITPASTAYRGHFYVLAGSNTNEAHRVFAATAADTLDQPGDKTGGSVITPPADESSTTAKAGSVNTGVIVQPQYAALLSLALLALIIGGCAVYRKRVN